MNLLNIRRVAWGLKEVDDLRREAGQAVPASAPAAGCGRRGLRPEAGGETRFLPQPGGHRGHHPGSHRPAEQLILFLERKSNQKELYLRTDSCCRHGGTEREMPLICCHSASAD